MSQSSVAKPAKNRAWRFGRRKTIKKLLPLYLLIAVPVVWTLIFCYYPMYGAQIAFRDFSLSAGIWGSPWIGFRNFIDFFTSYNFLSLLGNTLSLSVYYLVANTLVVLTLSLLIHCLDGMMIYKKIVQTVIYLPHFISTVVIVGILMRLLSPQVGMLSKFIQALGGTDRDLMGISPAFPHIYVWSGIWQSAGWGTIIYLASLSSAGVELHEAATVDGASRFQRLIHVDLPVIIPTAVVMLILNMGTIIDVGYEKVLLMQNSLNLSRSEVISTYVYKVGIANSIPDYSLSTTVGLFNSVVSLTLITAVNFISRKMTETSLW